MFSGSVGVCFSTHSSILEVLNNFLDAGPGHRVPAWPVPSKATTISSALWKSQDNTVHSTDLPCED